MFDSSPMRRRPYRETMGARTAMAAVCTASVFVQGVVLPIADIFGRHVQRMTALELAIMVAPVMHYMFQKGDEKKAAIAASGAVS